MRQAVTWFLVGGSIDLVLYAGLYATVAAAGVATGALVWWRLR